MSQDTPDVSTPSSAHTAMLPSWQLADTLLSGTEGMRAAAETYLPRHEAESSKAYANRLARATLLNMFEDTVDTLSGKPFDEPIVLGDDMPEQIVELCEDIDLQGTALQPFAKKWFREAWAKGLAHVLVDNPVVREVFDGEGNPRPRTLEDDRLEGRRPYWVLIKPENVIAAYAEMVSGRERLVHVRIMESSVERAGYGEKLVRRIRVLEPGYYELWVEKEAGSQGKKSKWEMEESGPTGLDEVPLRTYYAGKREGLMVCKPPLTDLAHLNITHWQSSADQRNILTVARFPILAAKGVEDADKVEIGPNKFLTTSESGEWYYVEHEGSAIEAGRNDLADLENQMASYGAEFLRKKPGGETATARAIDSSQSKSYLGQSVEEFQDCLEECLQLTAKWLGLDDGGSVKIAELDEEPAAIDAPVLDTLQKARAARDISRPAYLNELKRRKVLGDDFDADDDAELLAQERPTDGIDDMFGGGNGTQGRKPGVKEPGNGE